MLNHVALALTAATAANAYTAVNVEKFMDKNIDPIVFPGQYNKSHMHQFFGSDAVTINTTTSAELQKGCSTAKNPNDYSTYWIPALFMVNDTGSYEVPVYRFSAYYRPKGSEIAIPQDLKMVTGSAKATNQNESSEYAGVSWFCEGQSEDKDDGAFPQSTCDTHMQAIMYFPDCVNNETLTYAYSGRHNLNDTWWPDNRCPPNMYRIPSVKFSIRYDLRSILSDGWEGEPPLELASGNSYSMHGDFMNGWLEEAAENMIADEVRGGGYVGIDGPAGVYNAGSVCGAENAVDADPDHGTSDYATSKAVLAQSSKKRRSARGRRAGVRGAPKN